MIVLPPDRICSFSNRAGRGQADRDLLQSGWLIGEETLAKKAGMIAAQYEKGRVVLIGFRTQHRAQTHGAFKLLFNALIR